MICPNTRLIWTKWIILKVELVLPGDIYTDGILIIDDRYDRAKLNAPGVLHIERVAKMELRAVCPAICRPPQRLQ